MIKLIAFDLDLTLAPEAGPTAQKDAERIKKLSENGVRIAVCSGKPTCYLCGFLRQFGIKNPIMVGENGCTVQFGLDLPPKYYSEVMVSSEAQDSIKLLKKFIIGKYPDMWFQPNVTALTHFPTTAEQFDEINSFIDENTDRLRGIKVYRHYDSFDIIPNGISKRTGLEEVCRNLGITGENVIAVGDGINDYPMFDFAKYAVGIHVKNSYAVNENFTCLSDALTYIEDKCSITFKLI